jgi:2-methylcitrate dehydratase PrpD
MSAISSDLAAFVLSCNPEEAVRSAVIQRITRVVHSARRLTDERQILAFGASADVVVSGGIRSLVTDERLTGTDAAMLNGVVLATGATSPDERIAAAVIAAVLAYQEMADPGGDEPITALAVGMEIGLRMTASVGQPYLDRGWDVTGIAGSVGAAAAIARLAGLQRDAAMQALGVAATQGAGLRAAHGSDTWLLHVGRAAANGLEASLLCAAGFSGPMAGIEGRRGFLPVAAPEGEHSNLVDDLGLRWAVASDVDPDGLPGTLFESLGEEMTMFETIRAAIRVPN